MGDYAVQMVQTERTFGNLRLSMVRALPPTQTKPISALESTGRAISSGQRDGENVPNPERTVETRVE